VFLVCLFFVVVVNVFSVSAECLFCNGMIIILHAESKMLSEMWMWWCDYFVSYKI